jgi:hypothetical protein
MNLESSRTVEPPSLRGSFGFTEADLTAAFANADPDEQLYYDVFGPKWAAKPVSEKLTLLARVAALAEAQAVKLNLEAVVEPQ